MGKWKKRKRNEPDIPETETYQQKVDRIVKHIENLPPTPVVTHPLVTYDEFRIVGEGIPAGALIQAQGFELGDLPEIPEFKLLDPLDPRDIKVTYTPPPPIILTRDTRFAYVDGGVNRPLQYVVSGGNWAPVEPEGIIIDLESED